MHDPDTDAARYLGDDLGPRERERFARHLLSCGDCRDEVDQARRGRALLETQRTVVPVDLRDRLRALVESEPPTAVSTSRRPAARSWPGQRIAFGVAACLAGVLAVAAVARTPEPAALRQAVQDYAAERLPGSGMPDVAAPDLSALRLQPVGSAAGSYAGLDVDGFAYRDPAGRRVVLYLSDEPFPEAPGAERLSGRDGPWIADRGDIVVLCARLPHSLLVVGEDRQLVRRTAGTLGVL